MVACILKLFIITLFSFCNGRVVIQNGPTSSQQIVTLYLQNISNENCSSKWITHVSIFNDQIEDWVNPTDYTHNTNHGDKYVWNCSQSDQLSNVNIANCSFYLPISIKLSTNQQPLGNPVLLVDVIQNFNANATFVTECDLCTEGAQTCQASDPFCDNGIRDQAGCCSLSCGICGGSGCSQRPGGVEACCSGRITASGNSCDNNTAPCVITSSRDPTKAPTTHPTYYSSLDPTNEPTINPTTGISPWFDEEPNNARGVESCVELRRDSYFWNDRACNDSTRVSMCNAGMFNE